MERRRTVINSSIGKVEVSEFTWTSSPLCFTSNIPVHPLYLKPELAPLIEKDLKRVIRLTLLSSPEVRDDEPLIVVDCGMDSYGIQKRKKTPKNKTIFFQVFFGLNNRRLTWEEKIEVAKAIIKPLESAVIRELTAFNQIVV